jgi:hypothetical protein
MGFDVRAGKAMCLAVPGRLFFCWLLCWISYPDLRRNFSYLRSCWLLSNNSQITASILAVFALENGADGSP